MITIMLNKKPPCYILPLGMYGPGWERIKRDYHFFFEEKIHEAEMLNLKAVHIPLIDLPPLIDDFENLKFYMKYVKTEKEWYEYRELAKGCYTAPCIWELDESNFKSQVLKKKKS